MPVMWIPPTTQKAAGLLFYLGGNSWTGFTRRLVWKKWKTWDLQASACPACWSQREVSKGGWGGIEMWATTPEPIRNTQGFTQLLPRPHVFLLHFSIIWWRGFQELTWQRAGPRARLTGECQGRKATSNTRSRLGWAAFPSISRELPPWHSTITAWGLMVLHVTEEQTELAPHQSDGRRSVLRQLLSCLHPKRPAPIQDTVHTSVLWH